MYFGSVSFFRHLIIFIILIAIIVPMVFMFVFKARYVEMNNKLNETLEILEQQELDADVEISEQESLSDSTESQTANIQGAFVSETSGLSETLSDQLYCLQIQIDEYIKGYTDTIIQQIDELSSDQSYAVYLINAISGQFSDLQQQLDEIVEKQADIEQELSEFEEQVDGFVSECGSD